MSVEAVVDMVVDEFREVGRTKILGRHRHSEATDARLALYLALARAGMTRTWIGRYIGRDHGAVSSGIVRATGLMTTCPRYGARVRRILDRIDAAGLNASLTPASAPVFRPNTRHTQTT